MDFTVDWEEGNNLRATVRNITAGEAAALRFALRELVPTVAIGTVGVEINTSSFPDDVVAHRIGLLTLRADPLSFRPSRLRLNVAADDEVREVLARDLVWEEGTVEYPDNLLLSLLPWQTLRLTANTALGIGKEHIKWSPCFCRFEPRREGVWPRGEERGDFLFFLEGRGHMSPTVLLRSAVTLLPLAPPPGGANS